MNAYILHGINQLRYEQTDRPVPGPGEVLLQIKACGICGSDIPRIYRTGAHSHPLIPGHEFAGIVAEAGEQAEALYWKHQGNSAEGKQEKRTLIGKRMGVFPLIPCGTCRPCREGHYELCRNYSYLGSRRNGGFAEYAVVPAANLIELPDTVSFEEGAMLEPMAVAVHAMRRAGLESMGKEEPIAVCGLGTIGLLLILFLREAGFRRILAIGNKEFQREEAMRIGLVENRYCDSSKQDVQNWMARQTERQGASVFFECVGKEETISLAAAHVGPAGRMVLVGNPDSDIALSRDIYWKILRNQMVIIGTWNSSFTHQAGDDWQYVLERLEKRTIEPAELITHRLPLEGLEQGLHMMRDKSEVYSKIMGIR